MHAQNPSNRFAWKRPSAAARKQAWVTKILTFTEVVEDALTQDKEAAIDAHVHVGNGLEPGQVALGRDADDVKGILRGHGEQAADMIAR